MKKVKSLCALTLALLLLLSISACGSDDLAAGNGSPPPVAGGSTDSMPEAGSSQANPESSQVAKTSAATMEIKICTVDGNSVRGVGLSETYPEAYDFLCPPEKLIGADVLRAGMVVEVGFDGTVLETWPAQIQVDSVTVKEQQTDYFSLYYQILEDILGEDEGLNGDVSKFGFDFSEISMLSETEKQLLALEFSSAHQVEPLQGTLTELMDDGVIDRENLYWEDGLHFTIKEEEVKSDSVTFSVTKWRSGLGATGYRNTASKAPDNQWVFAKITEMWIS